MLTLQYLGGGGQGYGIDVYAGPNATNQNTEYFTIRISNLGSKNTYSAHIRIQEFLKEPKTYLFGQNNGEYYADGPNHPQMTLILSSKDKETEWYYSSPNSGQVEFTRIDSIQNIYSGRFSANLYNRFNTNQTINITEGRFDINTRTLNK